jgi:methionyl-tRNA formyltransferase
MALGMLGAFSAIPLERMLDARVDVIAVVVPAPSPTALPARLLTFPPPPAMEFRLAPATQRNVVQLARDHAIPVLEVGRMADPQTLSLLRALQPDLIVAACFPFILPRSMLQAPTHGCWNLHPSLLPRLRGPAPLFWVFHEGCCAGVTLHRMSERVDAGEIIAQTSLAFPDGMRYAEAEQACAQAGARLLLDALHDLERGRLHTSTQDECAASTCPSPSAKDFSVAPDWPVRRAFNFIRGVQGFAGACTIRAGEKDFAVAEAVAYRSGASLGKAYRVDGDRLYIRCADGVLEVRLTMSIKYQVSSDT